MTSPDPVPAPLGPPAAIVTTEGTTWSATEVTGQALSVWEAVEEPEVTLEPDDCVVPTMRPPATPPTTSAVPSATHSSHRRGLRGRLGSPTTAPDPGRSMPQWPLERTRSQRDYRTAWQTRRSSTFVHVCTGSHYLPFDQREGPLGQICGSLRA